jgi:hypothetical protein
MYHKNRALFESEHAEVYKEDLKRIERVIGNFGEVVSYPVILNFQKLMSLKVSDLLLGEPPQFQCEEEKQQTAVDKIIEKSDGVNTSQQVAIDASRYGDGLFYVRKGNDGGMIDVTNPCIWFPIANPDNVREITNHVLAWKYKSTVNGEEREYLKAQVHYKGYYEETVYELQDNIIAKTYTQTIRVNTGLDDFAVIQVPNVITSDRATGYDDYTDIDSIIAEIMVRVGQIAKILDKHASPSMSGPASALEKDPQTGEYRLKAGNYFTRETGEDAEVKYITWEGQLEANFKQIDRLVNLLYTISEMGSAIFGDLTAGTGTVPSGTALKRLMISPLAKVNRLRMRFDPALKKAIALCSQLGGKGVIKLLASEISINWQDGLPSDPMEEALIIEKRTAGAQTMSINRVLTQYDGMTEESAQAELDLINEETAMSNPLTGIPQIGGEDEQPIVEEV